MFTSHILAPYNISLACLKCRLREVNSFYGLQKKTFNKKFASSLKITVASTSRVCIAVTSIS